MNMKKYTADTMVDAMKKVRADFGDDAIILSSNVVQSKGFLGLFKKKSVEVVAGFDAPSNRAKQNPEQPIKTVNKVDDSTLHLQREMLEMKKMLKNLQRSSELSQYPDELQPILSQLKKQGLSIDLITEIGDAIFTEMKNEKKDMSKEEQHQFVKRMLMQKMNKLPFGGISFQKKYINVLGPTGVGKTTTIAKVAARALLEKKKKIGFITTDTYRIAAIEQLRTYANLLQAPVEVVYNKSDFKKAVEKFAHLDHIFIDTAGRNYKEEKFIEDLKKMIDFSLDMETFLVLSMTSKEQDMKTIVERFYGFPIEKYILTKVDETNSVGALFNLMEQYGHGVAYYTDGQEVPEDLVEATIENVIDLLLEEQSNA